MAFDEQEETLWKAFSDCGEVTNVRLVRDAKTNLGKGIDHPHIPCYFKYLNYNNNAIITYIYLY